MTTREVHVGLGKGVPSPMTKVRGTFQNVSWDEDTYEDLSDGAKLTRALVVQQFTGDIEGDGVAQWLMAYRHERDRPLRRSPARSGAIGERSGTFLLETIGEFDGKIAAWTATVVPGSGLDGLKVSPAEAPSKQRTARRHLSSSTSRSLDPLGTQRADTNGSPASAFHRCFRRNVTVSHGTTRQMPRRRGGLPDRSPVLGPACPNWALLGRHGLGHPRRRFRLANMPPRSWAIDAGSKPRPRSRTKDGHLVAFDLLVDRHHRRARMACRVDDRLPCRGPTRARRRSSTGHAPRCAPFADRLQIGAPRRGRWPTTAVP